MKKTTFLIILFVTTFLHLNAQLSEDFEGAFPPTNWTISDNGTGTTISWESNAGAFSGTGAAFIDYDGTGATEDWLISPQFTPTATENILTFFQKQDDIDIWSSSYTVRVKNITDVVDFVTVDTQSESDFGIEYSLHTVDLSAYDGKMIQIAFVLSQNNGDSWYVDKVSTVNPTEDIPNCTINPSPSIAEMDVTNLAGEVSLSWSAPETGAIPTSYEIYSGTTSGSLGDPIAEVGNTNYTLTGVLYETTYYWKIIPKNHTTTATSCVEWSFTTGVSPGVPSNDSCATAINIPTVPYENTQDATYAKNNYPQNNGFVLACDDGMNDGVWYTFTTVIGGTVNISITDVSSLFDVEVAVYSGSCNSFTCVGNKNTLATGAGASESLSVSVDAATQYWINVGSNSDVDDEAEGAFKIALTLSGGGTLGVDEIDSNLDVNLYPNPTRDIINVKYENTIDAIRIYNLLGQEVKNVTLNKTRTQIDMSNFNSGMYVVEVYSGNSKGSYRVIKQ